MRPRRLRLRPLVFRRDRVSADWACLYYKLAGFSIYQSDFSLAKDNLRHGILAISSRIRNDIYACMVNWRPPR